MAQSSSSITTALTLSGGGTSSRKQIRQHEVMPPLPPPIARYIDGEWESKQESTLQRQVEEARARATQMEKTMRWWSDCTANWREKWSKVRNERNRAREELKAFRAKYESTVKDSNALKYEFQELEMQNEQLKKEMDKILNILLKHAGQFDQQIISILESDPELKNALGIDQLLQVYNNVKCHERVNPKRHDLLTVGSSSPSKDDDDEGEDNEDDELLGALPTNREIEEYVLQGAVPKHAVELYKENDSSVDLSVTSKYENGSTKKSMSKKKQSSIEAENEEFYMQKLSALYSKIEEANSTIDLVKEEKMMLRQDMDKLEEEMKRLQEENEKLRTSRYGIGKESEIPISEPNCESELEINPDACSGKVLKKEGSDHRLSELCCIQLERLQSENAAEWGKRERLESEKNSLQRENKQLRGQIQDLEEQLSSKKISGNIRSLSHENTKILQQQIAERNEELIDVKDSYAKLTKTLGEKTMQVSHALRRSEQYELEVKHVRERVEELKMELSTAQDQVDTLTSNIRKLQRINSGLTDQLALANARLEQEQLKNDGPDSTTTPDVVAETIDENRRDEDSLS